MLNNNLLQWKDTQDKMHCSWTKSCKICSKICLKVWDWFVKEKKQNMHIKFEGEVVNFTIAIEMCCAGYDAVVTN